MNLWLALIILTGVVSAVLLLRFLPVGKLHGNTIHLHEWHRWRHNLRFEKIDRLLANAKALPPEKRLRPLAKLAHKYAGEPLGPSDRIMEEIGALGTDDSLPLIANLLRDTASISARPLLRGILTACRKMTVSTKWRRSLFEALALHVDEPEWPGRSSYFDHFYDVLLALDGPGAMELLCTCERMAPTQPELRGMLHSINLTGGVVPRPVLEPLIASQEGESIHGDTGLTLEVLEAWAAHDPAGARAGLWNIIRAGGAGAADAAESFLGLEDLPHPRFAIDARVARLSLGGVGAEEQTVWLVDSCYIYPLSCNPLITFFEEDYADRFEAIIAALRTIGALKHAGWLAEAGALFGKDGPGKSPQERAQQMAAMLPSAAGVFEAFENKAPGIQEDVKLLNLIYVLEHAAEFPRGLSFLGGIQK